MKAIQVSHILSMNFTFLIERVASLSLSEHLTWCVRLPVYREHFSSCTIVAQSQVTVLGMYTVI